MMAKVPESPGRTVLPTGSAPAYASESAGPNNFGVGIGQGLQKLAFSFKDLQDSNDDAAAMDAYAKASLDRQSLLYDPTNGVYSTQGAAATSSPVRFDTETRSIGEKHSTGLSLGAQEKFDKMWQRSNLADRESILRHTLSETEKFKSNAADGVMSAALGNAVQGYSDPEVIKRSKSEITGAVAFKMRGQSPDAVEEVLKTELSKMHMGVLNQVAAADPVEAYNYLKLNKGEMTPADYVNAVSTLKPKLYEYRVQEETDNIANGNPGVSTAWKSMYPEVFDPKADGEGARRAAVEAMIPARFIPDGQTRAGFMALVQQESGFNPDVVVNNPHLDRMTSWLRRSGGLPGDGTVVGLTQIMVYNARRISAELGDGLMDGKSRDEIIDILKRPEINLRYGSYQFSKSLKRFGGDFEAALVDYNSGRGEQWLKAGRDYSVIPHGPKLYGGMTAREQTIDYVQKVMGNYRRNVGADTPKTKASFELTEELASGEEVKTAVLKASSDKSRLAVEDLEPEFKVGFGTMLVRAPKAVREAVNWDGVTSQGGASVNLTFKTDFARQWVRQNAAVFGLNVPVDTDKIEKASSPSLIADDPAAGEAVALNTNVPRIYDEPSLENWIAQADGIQDPKLRKDVVAGLRQKWELYGKAEKQRIDTIKKDAWDLALQGKEIPSEMKAELTPEYMNSISAYQAKIKKGEAVATDWGVWADIGVKSKEELATMDPMVYRDKLADVQFNKLIDLVRDARGSLTGPKKGVLAQTSSTNEIIRRTVQATFGEDRQKQARFSAAVDEEIDHFFQDKKRNPTATEKQQIVDELLIQGRYNEGDRLFEVRKGEKVDVTRMLGSASEIPTGSYTRIASAFRKSQNLPISEDQATAVYSASLIDKRGATAIAPAWARAMLRNEAKKAGRPIPTEEQLDFVFTRWSKYLTENNGG